MAIERFYWMEPDVLAGCSRPGGRNGDATRLDDDLRWLRTHDIGAVLTLTETALTAEVLARHDLATLHLSVPDLAPPTPDQFLEALDFLDQQRAQGRPVAVHCLMGQGRTATVLAAHLIRHGTPAAEAVAHLRAICPGAISSQSQEEALAAFAARRDWVL